MENKKAVKPKQYSHIDYEALLIYIKLKIQKSNFENFEKSFY